MQLGDYHLVRGFFWSHCIVFFLLLGYLRGGVGDFLVFLSWPGGASFPCPLGLRCPSYPGWGDVGHCIGLVFYAFPLV